MSTTNPVQTPEMPRRPPESLLGAFSSDSGDPVAVTVARAALYEVGRPDLASQVTPNRKGHPSGKRHQRWDYDDRPVLIKAFRLGHLADPNGAHVACGHDNPPWDAWIGACDNCDCEYQTPPKAEWDRKQ